MSKYKDMGFEGRAKLTEIFNAVRADRFSAPKHIKAMTELLRTYGRRQVEGYIYVLEQGDIHEHGVHD